MTVGVVSLVSTVTTVGVVIAVSITISLFVESDASLPLASVDVATTA